MSETHITAEQLCALTGLTDRRHRQLASAGHFPPPINSKYVAGKTLQGLLRYAFGQLRKKNDELGKQKIRHMTTKADREEFEFAKSRGEYLLASEVCPALRNIGTQLRAQLLRTYEQELVPKLAGKSTIEILAMVKDANDEMIRVTRENMEIWTDDTNAKPALTSPATLDPEPGP